MDRKKLLKKYLIIHLIMVFLFLFFVIIYSPDRFVYHISRFLPINEEIKNGIKRNYYKNYYMNLNESEKKGGFVFLGNSIIYGYPLDEHFPDYPVLNRGIEGDTTEGILERLETNVLNLKPKKIFIMAGINDILYGVDLNIIKNNYEIIIKKIEEVQPNTQIYIKSILPLTKNRFFNDLSVINDINMILADLSTQYKNVNFIELRHLFTDDDGYLDEKYTMDGKNLNITGYKKISEEIKKYIEEMA